MAERIAGTAFLTVGTQQMALRGDFVVSSSPVERTMRSSYWGVTGYTEQTQAPYIEATLSTMPGFLLEDLLRAIDVTVVAQLANGMQYQLNQAVCKGNLENQTRDGQVRVRWEGVACIETVMPA
jgi:hypothetical protein